MRPSVPGARTPPPNPFPQGEGEYVRFAPRRVMPSGRWSDLRLRVLSAAVLAPLALICIWLGGMAFGGLMLVATVGLVIEWLGMVRQGHGTTVILVAGAAYILLAAAGLIWLREDPAAGRANLLFLLVLVWASDIGAYAAGRAIGGPRLAPRISPGKTVSGALGGLLAAVLVGVIAAPATAAPSWRGGLIAGLLGIVAQAGDLGESHVKRQFGVKDSGRLIPGHGGLLDRLDALLAAALAASLLALMEGRGVVLWR
ncbi:MAG TPA: phosphatidate cytidylyltransferase [Acetobacteraceae bacterium]|nr:phosphatidate cytidylyltransferase [Acetobacteraceae bacterium]